jgi:hypothetical protein
MLIGMTKQLGDVNPYEPSQAPTEKIETDIARPFFERNKFLGFCLLVFLIIALWIAIETLWRLVVWMMM